MLTFIIHYNDNNGAQRYIISADSNLNFEHQLNNFLKLNNLSRNQVTIELISSIY